MVRQRIVVLGSTNTDMVVKAPRIPRPGETILGGDFLMNPGGKGANQAVAAARLGGDVLFIAKVGDDLFGRETRTLLARERIDLSRLFTDSKKPSGVALIMVDSKGENCISVASGANGTLSPQDLATAKTDIESAALLLMQLETPLDTILTAARWASARGVPVILNPAPARPLPQEIFPCLTAITPNETEAEGLTGVAVTDEPSARRAAAALHKMGVRQVVITMGAKGAFISDGTLAETVPSRRVKAVDTTGAGDTFNGALAVALSEGKPLPDAVRFAAAAAAVSVTRLGAQASIPYRKELGA
jgi:ribokinase